MAAAPLYCVCRQPYDVSRFMIECDICKDWFHGSCVQVEEHHAVDIDVYHCPNCDVKNGPSLMKKRNNWHRHDYTEPDDGEKPVQAGTSVFIKQLQDRTFPSAEEILIRMKGEHVTTRYLERHGFNYPIAITEMEGLGLKLPPPTFSVKDVEQYVGGDKVIDVIDVARQADSKMKLSEFIKYFTKPHRPKVLNLISLEFSDTKMAELVEVPVVARKMSWVENYWPDDSFFPKPFVQKYCLMGVKDSYTDFHIDFGGTSVWYHVLWGEKIFYLIKPTSTNLALYEAWSSSPNQSEVFFGDKVDKCYKCVVSQGTTLLIPTGWIHGVLTSQDCMAFGGNFLHNLNIGMQLRCYEMERRLKTPDLFKFPYFEAICWYVAKNLLEMLKELREDNCPPPTYIVDGVKALISALRTWLKREMAEPTSEVPDNIRPNHLIKELTKEIRYLEEEPGSGSKPVKSQGCGIPSGSNGCPATRSALERLCQARRARRAARRLREQQQQLVPSNLDILEQHTREVLKRLEVGPLEEDPAFCAKVHGKLNKVSTASAAAAAESLEDNHLRLMLVNGRIIRDLRKPGSSPVKTEGEWLSVGQSPPKSCVDVKSERTQDCRDQHSTAEKPTLLRGLERVKAELREEVSGHSSVSDGESDSDSATEHKVSSSSSSSDEDSESSQEDEEEGGSSEQTGSGHTIELDQFGQKLRHKHKPLKRERPTSPSTEEAIQGMLTMAGLLCSSNPEKGASPQEPWWSSQCSPQEATKHQLRLQGGKSPMDSQGNSSSEAWDNQGLPSPETDYQYCDPSMSPPLHPSKRHAPNPPPISNQATKGKRPKKGMATAKQRLGKILKLNRQSRVFV
ncbi:LOW QUALITY PROTEIN: lysine-specific demethylase 7A [Melanotaenia boesemani]|uniref:LOW QUALITY PROTEIN: lysine-specific demethylase 7A n=1 Tax=Melanotaenia boesemani TaxID=1250792 RepID=UPI001C057B7F|nr:LOW QUALITY PROTEIN: lysine-specific demethylase 7A [Melanotaenia boesemani]